MSASGQADMSPIKRALAEIKRLRTKLDAEQQARKEPIAIIGMGCRFPGGADSPEAFWRLLQKGGDAVRDIPPGRWDVDSFYSSDPDEPGKMYTRRGAFLDPIDLFDPKFFGITPREAISVDPQQRLLLEVIWEALEHAGRRPDGLSGSVTGVYLGAMNYDYQQLQRSLGDPEAVDGYTVTGSLFSVLGGRMSYAFGLQGPNVSVDTACSSSLVTTHLACQGLRNRECELALAGGVNMILAPEPMIERCKARMLATDGWCKTFDATADGYVVGEGCGIVVLKRLTDAQRDGDPILAVILGSAVNHDGPSSGLTVPNGPAQQALLKRALAAAGVAGRDIDYVEAHGTGTSLGDPIEINALNAVLGGERERKLAVGSVKTNIGHLESAAGAAGLIKLVLALQHEELPPHLHFKEPNPLIPWNEIPVTVPTDRTPWRRGDKPRLAGLSSFGVSGTNAHLVVGEAPQPASPGAEDKVAKSSSLLLLSARSSSALERMSERYGAFLSAEDAPPLADVAATAASGRTPFAHRLAIAGQSSADVGNRLLAYVRDGRRGAIVQAEAGRRPPKIAFLFSGQGSQQAGMAKGLYDEEPVFRQQLDRADELLRERLGKSLKDLLWAPENAPLLEETAYTQPVLFALQMALVALWRSWGVEPAAVFGHSVGEIAAACTAGVLTLEDGVRLAAERGALMQSLPEGGKMVAVFASEEAVRQILDEQPEVTIAALNAPRETVISGPRPALEALLAAFREQHLKSRLLAVSHAFHSPLIEPILPELGQCATSCQLTAPRIPWVSGVTGKLVAAQDVTSAAYWTRQARETVRFVDAVNALAAEGCELFVEIGPGTNLIALGRRSLPEQQRDAWLPSLRQNRDDRQQMLESLGALYIRGVEIDWQEAHGGYQRRIAIPTSVFERKSYWFTSLPRAAQRQASTDRAASHPLLGQCQETPLDATLFDVWLNLKALPFLNDHRLLGTALLPATAILEAALAAAEEVLDTAEPVVENVIFQEPLVVPESGERHIQWVIEKQASGSTFKLFTRDSDSWSLHAAGRLGRGTCDTAPAVLAEARERCAESVEVSSFYTRLRQLGLEYGDSFRGLEEIRRGEGEALGLLRLSTLEAVHPKRPHPATLDACLQLALAAGGYDRVDAENPRVPVPFRFGRLSWSGATTEGRLWAHAAMQGGAPDAPEIHAEITLFSDDGTVLGRIEDLVVRRVEPRVLQRGVGSFEDRWLVELEWQAKKLGPAAKTAGVSQAPGIWLIWPDADDGVAQELTGLLETAGQTCIQLSADSLRQGESWLGEGQPPLRGLVFLGGLDAVDELRGLEEATQACADLLAAVHAVTALTAPGKARVFIATRGAQQVAENTLDAPLQATLWGFGRTLARELPDLWGALVDLDPQSSVTAAATDLFNEIWRFDGEDQIGYRSSARHVARLAKHRGANRLPARLDPLGTYLITGGLGALGLRVARWMIGRGARHLALLGRSAPSENARKVLADFAAEGIDVQIFAVDVASYDSLEQLFAQLASSMPPLKGIVHSAGVLADGVLLQQDATRLAKVFAPKVMGAWNLHRLSAGLKLDFFILFSSMTGMLGSAGQVNYAAANSFLDALAQARKAQGLPSSSLAWGTWDESGMAAQLTDRDRQRWAASGIEPLDPEGALGVLDVAVRQQPAQLGILAVDWNAYVRKLPGDGIPPFFSQVASPPPVAAKPTAQTAEAKRATKREYWRQLPSEQARSELLEKTTSTIEEILGFPEDDDASRLDPEEDLFKTGMDSLTALEVHNELQEILGQELSNQLLVDHTTIASIVDHLVGEVGRSAEVGA